jgi:hypothetical protein
MFRQFIFVVTLAAAAGISVAAQAPDLPPDVDTCRERTQLARNDGRALYEAALGCEAAGDRATAANAYRQSMALNFQPAKATAHLAGIFLTTGQKARALRELRTSLKQDCALDCTEPEACQFDFWIGDWEVQPAAGRPGRRKIQAALNGCALLESWSGKPNRQGISLLFHDPAAGGWRHYGETSEGIYFEASGKIRDGALQLSGERPFPHRRTLTPLPQDRLRATIERSHDGGATWIIVHDAVYTRRR